MTFAAVLSLPFGIANAGADLLRLDLVALGAAVALLSSTIPYALELIALRRLPAAAFSILMALAPATAALAGFLLLGQHLTVWEMAGIVLVIAASVGAVRAGGPPRRRHRRADRLTLRLTGRMTVVVCGPAAWNHLILLDRLPEPVPHMQFASASVHTVGGTSAGKAVHLADAGVAVRLHALLGEDAEGVAVAEALRRAEVEVVRHVSAVTEQHVNLMTAEGGRVSLYVATPSPADESAVETSLADLATAEIAVVDLGSFGAELIRRGVGAPVWTDLHDYDGSSAFHEPFLRAAEVVFMNDDAVDDPWALLRSCVDRGPRMAVCTRGAEGAIALGADGTRYAVAAASVDLVDTNGAGDAFFAGFLAAHLAGADVDGCLAAGAQQAVVALESAHLHPALA